MPSKKIQREDFSKKKELVVEVVDNLTTEPLDPWDKLEGAGLTIYKLYNELNNADSSLTSKLQSGEWSLPASILALLNASNISSNTDFDSLFGNNYQYSTTQIWQYSEEVYGGGPTWNSSPEDGLARYNFISHILLTNIFYNFREIYYVENIPTNPTNGKPAIGPSTWDWRPITHEVLTRMLGETNKYYIIKLDMSGKMKELFNKLKISTNDSGFPCHHVHAIPENEYMILSTEQLQLSQYYNLVIPSSDEDPDVEIKDSFFNDLESFNFQNTNEESTYRTGGTIIFDNSYSYMAQEKNDDIETESEGDPYVQR